MPTEGPHLNIFFWFLWILKYKRWVEIEKASRAPLSLFRPSPAFKHRDALPVATYETSRLSHFCDAFAGERGNLKLRGKAMS